MPEQFQIDDDTRSQIEQIGFTIEPCGSRVTCNPAPEDTDQDYLVALGDPTANVNSAVSDIVSILSQTGWQWEGDCDHYQNVAANAFMSWRKDKINLIVTASHDFARRHRAATKLSARLNLLGKPDRIALFQAVLYGNEYEPVAKEAHA